MRVYLGQAVAYGARYTTKSGRGSHSNFRMPPCKALHPVAHTVDRQSLDPEEEEEEKEERNSKL